MDRNIVHPTHQQQAIVDAALQRTNLVIQAGAGTGKSSTLTLLAHRISTITGGGARGLVLAYNTNAARTIAPRLAPGFTASTIHALANRAIRSGTCDRVLGVDGLALIGRIKPAGADLKPWELPKHLGITSRGKAVNVLGEDVTVTKAAIAACARNTIKHWCNTPETTATIHDVRLPVSVDRGRSPDLVDAIYRAAATMWGDLISPDGVCRFEHDHYLKLWQLWMHQTGYQLPYGILCLDEAQDSNRLTSQIFMSQDSSQLVAVGDDAQTMYEWRGATNALTTLTSTGATVLPLTKSFRFGHEIADEANAWLTAIGNPFLLRGSDDRPGTVGHFDHSTIAHTVLCRTNAGVIGAAMAATSAGYSIHVVGGGRDVVALAKGCRDLQDGKRANHHLLAAFETWNQLVEYTESELCDEVELKLMVSLLDRFTPNAIMAVLLGAETDRTKAHTVLSTAHKFKGDESDAVAIGGDYKEPQPGPHGEPAELPRADAMAAYVAVTRAQRLLNPGVLGYIHRWNRTRLEPAAPVV